MLHGLAFENSFRKRVLTLDPLADHWLLGISWQFSLADASNCPPMPHPGVWTSNVPAAAFAAAVAVIGPDGTEREVWAALEGTFEICFPNGCFAESRVKGPTIDSIKKGATLNVVVRNQFNNEVTFALAVAGFGKAFDGPPIDPKVLEAQQKQLQEQMQKQVEDERKKLEGQGAAAPAPGAPAAPATPAPK